MAVWLVLLVVLFATDQATMEWVEREHEATVEWAEGEHQAIGHDAIGHDAIGHDAIGHDDRRDVFTLFEPYGTGLATVLIAGLIYAFDRERRARAFAFVLIVGLVTATNYSVKMLVGRERPAVAEQTAHSFKSVFGGPGGGFRSVGYRSFPSGHVAEAVSQSVVLAAFYPSAAPLLYPLAVLVAAARVYHEAHYPSDVAVAALLAYAMSRWLLRVVRL